MADKNANQVAVDALQAMSPARRAAQLFAATLTNAGNTATGGLIGYGGDIARGTPYGTTGDQIDAQVQSVAPVANTASKVIGTGAGIVGGAALVKAAAPLVGTALAAAPAVGSRAAALGVTSTPYAQTAAKFLAPAAAALGIGAYLNNGEAPVSPAVAATTAAATKAAPAVVAKAAPIDVQEDLKKYIHGSFVRGVTPAEAKGIGALVPAAIKTPTTAKDQAFSIASSLAIGQRQQQEAAIAQALAAGKTDQAGALEARSKADELLFNRIGGMVGYNPNQGAQAQLLQGGN